MPLRAQGRWVVDAHGTRVKLASVSWYGAESSDFAPGGLQCHSAAEVAGAIRALGFNSVRLPWSNELVERNPKVDKGLVKADSTLAEMDDPHGLEVFRHVVDALAAQHLMVVLDNHLSDAGWCCGDQDSAPDLDGLWWNNTYPEACWISDWGKMAGMFAHEPAVVGADLRNEPREVKSGPDPKRRVEPCDPKPSQPGQHGAPLAAQWGAGAPEQTDWRAAAVRGGRAVTEANPNLLVMVEGVGYGRDLTRAYHDPVPTDARELPRDRLVYSPHEYSDTAGDCNGSGDCSNVHDNLGRQWGFLIKQRGGGGLEPFTAPVWVGEFGTCTDKGADCISSSSNDKGRWFPEFANYLRQGDIDWSYWPVNGTRSTGASRRLGDAETYGVLDQSWSRPSSHPLLCALRSLEDPSQGPGVTASPAPGQDPPKPGTSGDPAEAFVRLRGSLPEPTVASSVGEDGPDCPLAATATGSTSTTTSATVWLFTTGAWEPAVTVSLPVPVVPRHARITSGDLTGQGTHDFIVPLLGADAELDIVLSDASGRWRPVPFRESGRTLSLVRFLRYSNGRLSSMENDCQPSCAEGTKRLVQWRYDADAGEFVTRSD